MKKPMESARVPQELVVGWNETLVQWTQKASHATLLAQAVKHNQLAWIATRYREAARSNPRDPIARDGMKAVQRAAAMIVFTTPVREPERQSFRALAMMLVGFVISIGVGLWAAQYQHNQRIGTLVSRQP